MHQPGMHHAAPTTCACRRGQHDTGNDLVPRAQTTSGSSCVQSCQAQQSTVRQLGIVCDEHSDNVGNVSVRIEVLVARVNCLGV